MIEPRWIEKWDYEFPNHFKEFLEVQTDWNQTLLTKVNLVSASSKYSLTPVFIAFCEKGDSVYNDDGELETELKNIHYKPSTEFTNEELIEHQNKLFGKIEILNYKKP